jgi:hypothetical protein
VHGAKHAWTSLAWILDLAALISCNPGIEWPAIIAEANSQGGRRLLLLGLYLAHDLLGAAVPENLTALERDDRVIVRLAAEVKRRMFSNLSERANVLQESIVPTLAIESTRGRIRYLAGRALAPTIDDWRYVELPQPLFALYYVLHPARLALPITLSDAGPYSGSLIIRPAQKAPSLAGDLGTRSPIKARINRGPCTNSSIAALVTTMVQVAPWRIVWTVALITLSSLSEGVGVALLFPTLEACGVNLESQGKAGHYARIVDGALSWLGLHPNLALLLSLYILVIASHSLIARSRNVLDAQVHQRIEDAMRRRLYGAICHANWLFIARSRLSDFNHFRAKQQFARRPPVCASGSDRLCRQVQPLQYYGRTRLPRDRHRSAPAYSV